MHSAAAFRAEAGCMRAGDVDGWLLSAYKPSTPSPAWLKRLHGTTSSYEDSLDGAELKFPRPLSLQTRCSRPGHDGVSSTASAGSFQYAEAITRR